MAKMIMVSIQLILLFTSCNVWRQTAKRGLTDGFYTQRFDTGKVKVYVHLAEESIVIYPTVSKQNSLKVDTAGAYNMYPQVQKDFVHDVTLTKTSFDLDFLTIPLKFRFSQMALPAQLNANINGAVFAGFRTDKYHLNYQTNPLYVSDRRLTHFGYSIGLFTGIGNTFMSPANTNNLLLQEYDGVIWSKGIAGIFGINNFTLGITVGVDNLLDKNRRVWIYDSKPWLGLGFGLNLN